MSLEKIDQEMYFWTQFSTGSPLTLMGMGDFYQYIVLGSSQSLIFQWTASFFFPGCLERALFFIQMCKHSSGYSELASQRSRVAFSLHRMKRLSSGHGASAAPFSDTVALQSALTRERHSLNLSRVSCNSMNAWGKSEDGVGGAGSLIVPLLRLRPSLECG